MIRILSIFCFFFVSAAQAQTLLIVGDSLSAGYNMSAEQSWPSLLPGQLEENGLNTKVINASISGDTTANGLQRLPDLLTRHSPDWVLLELGGNDGLRGWPFNRIRDNLEEMITLSENNGAKVLLMQINIPPNYGQRYSNGFAAIYPKLSKEMKTPLLPFFMEHVIQQEGWMLNDGIHPSVEAQPWIADFVANALTPHLTEQG